VLNTRSHNLSVSDESVPEPREIQLRYQSLRLDYENKNLAYLLFTRSSRVTHVFTNIFLFH